MVNCKFVFQLRSLDVKMPIVEMTANNALDFHFVGQHYFR